MGENLVGEKKGWGGLVCPCAVNGLRLDDGMNKGVTLDGCFFLNINYSTLYMQVYNDKSIPYGERIAHVAVFLILLLHPLYASLQ